MKQLILAFGVMFTSIALSFGQAPENWFNLAFDTDSVYGAETEKAYELLKGKKGKEVVVAVIDSGVDEDHEDLSNVMWVNPNEVMGNGVDDDNNGYIDDIYGWNFIGGPEGNVDKDNLEVTRLYRMYEEKFKDVSNPTTLSGKDREEYARYLKVMRDTKKGRESAEKNLDRYKQQKANIYSGLDELEKVVGKDPLTLEMLDEIDTEGNSSLALVINIAKNGLNSEEEREEEVTVDYIRNAVDEGLSGAIDYFETQAEYHYNKEFNPRPIVGDDYSDPYQRDYGNNEYEGPDAFHGTHVAGIIAAERNNEIGMNGVADMARIMTIRTVPDGDERDKDVASAIIYAVDNGASVINMSFGKGYSWNKKVVDEAVKYAAKNDVLLVHAAGNSGQNNDSTNNFPNDTYEKSCWFCSKDANDNWIEVGALSYVTDENLPASFSNYGEREIDLFAPGVAIYSTTPDNKYRDAQGTSMASPVVAGVAALIRSYFPDLTAKQVKEILMESATRIDMDVKKPGTQDLVPFSSLSATGGTVNAYQAVKLAMNTKGKK